MTLAEAIRRAIDEHAAMTLAYNAYRPSTKPPPLHDHIAAAVAAHLVSEAVVERARVARCRLECCEIHEGGYCGRECRLNDVDRAGDAERMGAAIRAALGEHEGVGRG